VMWTDRASPRSGPRGEPVYGLGTQPLGGDRDWRCPVEDDCRGIVTCGGRHVLGLSGGGTGWVCWAFMARGGVAAQGNRVNVAEAGFAPASWPGFAWIGTKSRGWPD
jgi:hypothetical protein